MPNNRKTEGKIKTPKHKGQNLLRQKRLAKILAEDGGKTPIGKLMLQAGYNKGYARNPDKLKKTASWQELMEKNLPDDLLAKRHHELLGSMEIGKFVFPNAVSDEEIKQVIESDSGLKLIKVIRNAAWARAYFSTPDNRSRKDALDLAYKLKAKYPKESSPITQIAVTDDQLKRILDRPKDK